MKMRRQLGQTMVEAALAIPLLILCVVAVIYFGRAYYLSHVIAFAAQDCARLSAGIPQLNNPDVRNALKGFNEANEGVNPDSAVYRMLGSARLLSNGTTGNLPSSAKVQILPWDDGSIDTAPGTVTVLIEYPFSLFTNPFTGETGDISELSLSGGANSIFVPFLDFKLRETATVSQLVAQEEN